MTCRIDGCEKPREARRRVCAMHFGRWRKYRSYDLPVREPIEVEFWAAVDQSGDCWLYTGKRDRKGYGILNYKDQQFRAHRLSYELVNGSIPDGLYVCHHCDNPPCVRPSHLFAGRDVDNIADMVTKKRHNWGERNARHKLTASEVREIRTRAASGEVYRTIAEDYDISETTISDVHRRRSWRHLD